VPESSAQQAARASDGVLESVMRMTVSIEGVGAGGQITGSGVLVGSTGVIAIAAHVLRGARSARVRLLTPAGKYLADPGRPSGVACLNERGVVAPSAQPLCIGHLDARQFSFQLTPV
jgi:hypothetical protein